MAMRRHKGPVKSLDDVVKIVRKLEATSGAGRPEIERNRLDCRRLYWRKRLDALTGGTAPEHIETIALDRLLFWARYRKRGFVAMRDLADVSGVREELIKAGVNGRDPGLRAREGIAAALGVPHDELWTRRTT